MRPSFTASLPLRGALSYVLLALLIIAGCGEPPEPPPEPEPIDYSVLARGQNAELPRDFEHEVIRTQEDWNAVVEQLRPGAPLPEVNFDEEMVLLAARRVNTGGHNIDFEGVERPPGEDDIVARYAIGVPDDDCMTTMAVATPFQVVSIPRTDAEVRFESRREIYRCSPRRGL